MVYGSSSFRHFPRHHGIVLIKRRTSSSFQKENKRITTRPTPRILIFQIVPVSFHYFFWFFYFKKMRNVRSSSSFMKSQSRHRTRHRLLLLSLSLQWQTIKHSRQATLYKTLLCLCDKAFFSLLHNRLSSGYTVHSQSQDVPSI